jgi:hypothetical protein
MQIVARSDCRPPIETEVRRYTFSSDAPLWMDPVLTQMVTGAESSLHSE